MTTAAMRPEVARLIREAVAASRSDDKPRSHILFRAVTQLDPENEAAWLWFANTASDPRDAVTGLRSILRLNPTNTVAANALPVALLRAGIAAAKANDRAAASELLADATEAIPDSATAWLWRAGVTDEPERAIEFLERVLRLNPDNPQAKQGIAKLRAQITPVRQCPLCENVPQHSDTVSDECGKCRAVVTLHRPELFDKAVPSIDAAKVTAAAKRLKAKWPTAPTAETAYALGLAYLNLGYADEGLQALQIAIRGRSPNPQWREAVARLVEHRQSLACATTARVAMPAARVAMPTARVAMPTARVEMPRIMVVDDSPTVRRMVSSILTKAGYRVTEASDAEHAAKLIHEHGAPRLFILDVNMPGTDGFGLCKYLRSDAETARVPIVFLTGKTGLLNKIHGKWVGAAEYLTKPFQPETLIATANRLVPIAKR